MGDHGGPALLGGFGGGSADACGEGRQGHHPGEEGPSGARGVGQGEAIANSVVNVSKTVTGAGITLVNLTTSSEPYQFAGGFFMMIPALIFRSDNDETGRGWGRALADDEVAARPLGRELADAEIVRGERRSHVPPGFYRQSLRPSLPPLDMYFA